MASKFGDCRNRCLLPTYGDATVDEGWSVGPIPDEETGMLTLFVIISAAAADCPELAEAIKLGEDAVCRSDQVSLEEQTLEIRKALRCIEREAGRKEIKAIHRLHAVAARFPNIGIPSVQAMIRTSEGELEPSYVLEMCDGKTSEGGPQPDQKLKIVGDWFATAHNGLWLLDPVSRPRSGDIRINGIGDMEYPRSEPYIFIHKKGTKVHQAAYIPLDERLPFYPRRHHVVLATGGALLVSSAVTGILAADLRQRSREAFLNGESSRAERLERDFFHARAGALVAVAGGASAVGAWFVVPLVRKEMWRRRRVE